MYSFVPPSHKILHGNATGAAHSFKKSQTRAVSNMERDRLSYSSKLCTGYHGIGDSINSSIVILSLRILYPKGQDYNGRIQSLGGYSPHTQGTCWVKHCIRVLKIPVFHICCAWNTCTVGKYRIYGDHYVKKFYACPRSYGPWLSYDENLQAADYATTANIITCSTIDAYYHHVRTK